MSIFSGVILALLAALFFNLGAILQKRGAERLPKIEFKIDLKVTRAFITSGTWMSGLLLGFCGAGVYITAVSRTPISIVQPIVASGIVILALFAVFYLHERLGALDWLGIGLASGGVLLISLSIGPEAETMGEIVLMRLFLLTGFTVLISLLAGLAPVIPRLNISFGVGFGISVGGLLGLGAVYTKALTIDIISNVHPLEILGVITHVFQRPYGYFLAALNITGFFMLQSAFQRGKVLIILPVSGALANTVPIVGGMLIFGESLPQVPILAGMRIMAFVMIITGTAILSKYGGRE